MLPPDEHAAAAAGKPPRHRLYVTAALEAGCAVPLERSQAHYLTGVLRLKAGDAVALFNGRDGEWRAALGPGRIPALRVEMRSRAQDEAGDLWLAFAPLKTARLDYMAQKATEMGVSRLIPMLTRRTVAGRVNRERLAANTIEAAEQCGLTTLPQLSPPLPLAALLGEWPASRALIFADEAAPPGSPLDRLAGLAGRPLGLVIGPEGGFDDAERAALLAHPAACRISLGPRILRADTAAVAALAVIQATVGDWATLAENATKRA